MNHECHGLDTDDKVFFYEQEYYGLSNFSSFTVIWKNLRFDTSDAVYHWEKFNYLDPNKQIDLDILQERIRTAPSAHDAFQIAQAYKSMRRPDWDEIKLGIMRAILMTKVRQHEYVRRKLMQTGNRELIENSWRDDFYGIGPNGDGQNALGKLWMEIREKLKTDLVRSGQ